MEFMSGPEPLPSTITRSQTQTLPAGVIAIYPMTRTQEGLWVDYSFAPHRTHNNLTLKLTVTRDDEAYDGSLGAIHTAIVILTRRHAILRSTFHEPTGSQCRPFVAEHDPATAASTLHIIPAATTKQASANVLKMLRCGVDLSSHFAMRWFAVTSTKETEVYIVSHHIALDGASMSLLSVEFFDLLAELKNGPGAKASQALNFSQAHIYEAAFLSSAESEEALRFWLGQLTHANPIRWKSVHSSSDTTSYRSIQTWMDFSKKDLATWGNRFKTSWFRVAVAAIGLLTRVNSEPDHGSDQNVWVAFGGRPAGFENVLGHFANALPIRIPYTELLQSTAPGAPPRFDDLVRIVSKQISTAKKHERQSIMDIGRAANTKGMPVNKAQVAVTLSPKLSRADACLYPVEGPYELFFCFLEAETSVSLGVIYDPRIFSENDMNSLKTQFFEIQKATNLEASVDVSSEPGVLVPRIHPELDYNDIATISASRVHIWFEEQASRNPELIALHWGEQKQSLTYRALNESANQLAHYLRSLGISRGAIILLHIGRNFGTMEWILAVLKSGAAYAIVDQSHPIERNRAAISVAEPSVIVDDGGSSNAGKLFEGFKGMLIATKDIDLTSMPLHNPPNESKDDDLAYIVFTSGSTGKPKGVEIEHRNLAHFVADSYASKYVDLGPGSRVLQFATFSFDAAVLEWAQCLTVGATLCFVDTPKALVGDYLADVIDANEITFMHVTPSVLATLSVSRVLPSLRQISVGGEMVPAHLINMWRSRVHVQNAYGPTETTVVMAHQPQPSDENAKQPSSSIIGTPHRHTKFYISNETYDRILPVGKFGEVCIGGPQVGRGYKGLEDLTATRFAVHPDVGERLYRTGDRGKLLPNGAVSLVGRIDREVKVRGYRIELEAVERTISSLVADIASVSVQVNSAGTALCAFIAPKSINGEFVRSCLGKHLPDYMIPSTIYSLPHLPLNTNDKVDHKSIKAQMDTLIAQASKENSATTRSVLLTTTGASSSRQSSISSTPNTEDIIAEVWQTILGLSSRPASDRNFFDLGGNSLLVSRLAEELRQKFTSSNVRVVELYSRATIHGQVGLIDGNRTLPQSSPDAKTPSLAVLPESPNTVSASVSDWASVANKLTEIWQAILGVKNLNTQVNFFDAGGHSLAVSRLLQEIRAAWPTSEVKLVDLFHKSTIDSQVALILPSLPLDARREAPIIPPSQHLPAPSSAQESVDSEIAIIGLAGRFPGADSPDKLYRLLLDRREGFTTYPIPAKLPFKDAVFVPRKGTISHVEDFDYSFWGLKEDEARDMDPQTRLFMETTLEALEDASHVPSPDGRNEIGLCVGAAHDTWQKATESVFGDDFYRTHRDVLTPSLSARTAYHLNLHGPNVTLNTACSSGLVALSLAIDHLRSRQCDISVAGGVSIAFPQGGYITQERQIFSPSGHCRPFDHRADGTLPADGVCAVVLRRLSDAVRDGDRIYSVISGVAIGSDGRTDKAGYSVPSPRGQSEIIKRAWNSAGLDPHKLTYAELHGSGTSIGDALELEALDLALSASRSSRASCVIGSNKGNLGNCEAASGLVSVIKLCKSIQHGVVPPIQSFERINPMINPNLQFKIAVAPTPLSEDALLSVSSAGLGGVNAYCILRYPPQASRRQLDNVRPSRRTNVKRLVAPPRSEPLVAAGGYFNTEKAIALCASHLLGVNVEEDTDLRDAGLDSSTQVRLVRTLLDLFGPPSLGITAFLQLQCTPRTLSTILLEQMSVAPSLPPYASVLQHGNDTVYLLVAPGGGSCASFADLIHALPRSVTILGLEHPNFVQPSMNKYTVEDLSGLYIGALKQYCGAVKECALVGASFGGVVAIELAKELPQHGFTVSSISLLDTPWPGSLPAGTFSVNGFLRNVYGIIVPSSEFAYPSPDRSSAMPSTPSGERSPQGFNGSKPLVLPFDTENLEEFVANAAMSSSSFERVQKSDWRTLFAVYADNVCALGEYCVDNVRLDLPALYVHAGANALDRHALGAPWTDILPRLSVKHIDAPHASMYTGANAQVVAALMARIFP